MLMMALMMRMASMTMAMMMNERFAEGGRHLAAALMSSAAGRP